MTAFDKALALVCAKASSAAYIVDDAQRYAYLAAAGLTELGYLQSRFDARVLLCSHADFGIIRAHQGTQFTAMELVTIAANLKAAPADLGDGRAVHSGYLQQYRSVEDYLLHDPRPRWITGHSEGGSIAHIDANLHDWGDIGLVTFGAPMCGNAAFWQAAKVQPMRVVHEKDFAPGFPEISSFVQPSPFWWLSAGMVTSVDRRPAPNLSIADHDIETGYIAAIEALP